MSDEEVTTAPEEEVVEPGTSELEEGEEVAEEVFEEGAGEDGGEPAEQEDDAE